jgi:hypothetical protein
MRVSRRFNIKEGMRFEVLAEGFNLFNRTQVTQVSNTFYAFTTGAACPAGAGQCLTAASGFGQTNAADSTLFRERQVQLGARFEF